MALLLLLIVDLIMKCPCGLASTYDNCCGLYIEHKKLPTTAESLMRSRYSAYAINNISYIKETMRGLPSKGFSLKEVSASNSKIKWLSLSVLASTETTVEFKAQYRNEIGKIEELHENSLFKKRNNQWLYIGLA